MTVLGILGMTHDEELQKKLNFKLSYLKELILDFNPDVICGEVHPRSWELYIKTGEPFGLLGETQAEYPKLIFPLCEEHGIEFVPINWFEEDVFEEEPFDKFDSNTKVQLEERLDKWKYQQLSKWNAGAIPLNSAEYDDITEEMYNWLHTINPEIQNIVWNARNAIMGARVKNAIKKNPHKRVLCIHGADHNYWYYQAFKNVESIELIYPLR